MKKCECCNILLPSQTDCSSVMLAEKEVNSDIFDMKIMLAFCKNQNGRYSLLAEAAGSRVRKWT